MNKSITKVKTKSKKKTVSSVIGWQAVLADIQEKIDSLEGLAQVVTKKIERGEPWPTT